jgi:hypothetical protein
MLASVAKAAGPFADLPADHWAYAAVEDLYEMGFMQGFPDGEFKGNRTLTRYEVAMLVARVWYKMDELLAGGGVDAEAIAKIEKLANEFRTELADLGVQVDNIMATLDEQGSEIDRLKSMIHDTNITGSVRFRTGGFVQNQGGIDSTTGEITNISTDIGHELFGALNFHFMPNDVMDFDLSLVYAENHGPIAGLIPGGNDGGVKRMTPPYTRPMGPVTDSMDIDIAKLTVDLTPWVTWFGDTPTFTIGRQYFSFGEFGLTGDNGTWSDYGFRFDSSWGTNWNAWLGAYRLESGATSAWATPNVFVYGPSRSFQNTLFTTESDDFVIAGVGYNGAEGTVPGHDYTYDLELNLIPNGYGEEFYVGGSANFEIPWMAAGPWINGIRSEGVWVNTNVSDRDPDEMGLDAISWVADLDIYNNGTTKFVGSFAQITQLEGLPVYSNVDNDPFSEWDFTQAASGDGFNISREGKNYFPADFNGFGVSAEHTFTNGLFGKVIFYDGERRNSRFTDRPGLLRVMFKYPIYDNATVGLDIINAGMTDGLNDVSTLVRGELQINF